MLFENRRSRCKELGKKVPQAYRVYVEDTFLPYDAADACIFSKKPTPEFYVFYNGEENYPVNTTLKLSDAFITQPEHIPLELTVEVFNINKNKESQLLKTCKTLDEYSLFVEEVRNQKRLDPENGFTNAVKICIQKGILKEYLQRKSREVINMLIAEYDYDTDIAVQREEAGRIAFAEGIEQGIERGRQQGRSEGLQQGRSEGLQQGRSEGLQQGLYQKARESARILKQLHCDTGMISQATGLSQEEIEAL